MAAAVDGGSLLLRVDRPVQLWVLDHRAPWARTVAHAATELGAPASAFVLGLVLSAAAWVRRPVIGVAILVLTLARPLASGAVKELVDRDRPTVGALATASGQSFPSGHTLAAAVLFGSVVLAAGAWDLGGRVALIVAGSAGVALVAATRVYLGVHWLTDVIGGALLGGLLLAVVSILVARGTFEALLARRRSIR